jgi:catalase
LSLTFRPGNAGVRGRRVALLVADGVDGAAMRTVYDELAKASAVPRFVGARLGTVEASSSAPLHVEISLEAAPSALWDAVVLPVGADAAETLSEIGQALEFVKDQYRHCKPILVLDGGQDLLSAAGVPDQLPNGRPDPAIILLEDGDASTIDDAVVKRFLDALAQHRSFARETDPPAV